MALTDPDVLIPGAVAIAMLVARMAKPEAPFDPAAFVEHAKDNPDRYTVEYKDGHWHVKILKGEMKCHTVVMPVRAPAELAPGTEVKAESLPARIERREELRAPETVDELRLSLPTSDERPQRRGKPRLYSVRADTTMPDPGPRSFCYRLDFFSPVVHYFVIYPPTGKVIRHWEWVASPQKGYLHKPGEYCATWDGVTDDGVRVSGRYDVDVRAQLSPRANGSIPTHTPSDEAGPGRTRPVRGLGGVGMASCAPCGLGWGPFSTLPRIGPVTYSPVVQEWLNEQPADIIEDVRVEAESTGKGPFEIMEEWVHQLGSLVATVRDEIAIATGRQDERRAGVGGRGLRISGTTALLIGVGAFMLLRK